MAASWDVDAMHEWGESMGKEFYGKGANVQLGLLTMLDQLQLSVLFIYLIVVYLNIGPGVCLARVPRNGRNFEYLSGEDPYSFIEN